jgi:hypothetical protein
LGKSKMVCGKQKSPVLRGSNIESNKGNRRLDGL